MSFKPRENLTGHFFSAYRSTTVSISTENTKISMTAANDATISTGSVVTNNRHVYAVGEVQAASSIDYQLGDIKIAENTGSAAEGYQVRNNAAGTVLMDDACYGITSSDLMSLSTADLFSGGSIDAEAHEARIMGIYT